MPILPPLEPETNDRICGNRTSLDNVVALRSASFQLANSLRKAIVDSLTIWTESDQVVDVNCMTRVSLGYGRMGGLVDNAVLVVETPTAGRVFHHPLRQVQGP